MNKSKNSAVDEADQWLEYVAAVKKRDQARHAAEGFDKERRAAWREYYKYEKQITQMNEALGLNEMVDEEEPKPPNAPRKKRRLTPMAVSYKSKELDLTKD